MIEPKRDNEVSQGQSMDSCVPEIYANSARAVLSPYDLLVKLYRADGDPENPSGPQMELVGKLRMSHAQAWVLVKILDRLLNDYVEKVGPIHLPEDLVNERNVRAEYEEMLKKAKNE